MVQSARVTQQTIIIAGVLTVAATFIGTYFLYRKLKKARIPTEWQAVGAVKKLCIYPLKSAKRIEVDETECTTRGLMETEKADKSMRLRDRSFVVYHMQNYEYRTARHYPKLMLIEIRAHDTNTVVIRAPDMDPLFLRIPDKNRNEEVAIKHYRNETIFSIDCGNDAAKWISRYALEKDSGLRMAYHDGTYQRNEIIKSYADVINYYKRGLRIESGGLNSDLAAVHIINQASVLDINRRMGNSEVTVNNFRPNLVVDGPDLAPYEEDKWEWIKVGDVVMKNVMECVRCVMSTTDAETGVRRKDREPLQIMGKFRMSKGPEKGPVMGVLLEVFQTGIISVGDTVYVGK